MNTPPTTPAQNLARSRRIAEKNALIAIAADGLAWAMDAPATIKRALTALEQKLVEVAIDNGVDPALLASHRETAWNNPTPPGHEHLVAKRLADLDLGPGVVVPASHGCYYPAYDSSTVSALTAACTEATHWAECTEVARNLPLPA